MENFIIKIKRSTTTGTTPSKGTLQEAELAINVKDKILFSADETGEVFRINPEIDSSLSTSSENPIQNKAVATSIESINSTISSLTEKTTTLEENKVDKEEGKVLSTNDYTTDEKTKVSKIIINGSSSSFLSEDGQYHTLTKSNVGLDNVENIAPVNLPISTATQTALNLKMDKENCYTKEEVNQKISSAFNFKDATDNFSDLSSVPESSVGDLYYVRNTFNEGDVDYPAGTFCAYNGTSWIPLGTGMVDLSNYVTKAELNGYLQSTKVS